ncbi:MAG TPA: amino acid ABC transporter substrate-binding protein [Ktedonobacterales bacterium]
MTGCTPTWKGSDSAGGDITFGATISITGELAQEGQYTRDGYLMAINTINEEGGLRVGGKVYRLALRYYDDESQPDLAVHLYEQLINKDEVNFLLGPYSSDLTEAVAPLAERYHLPLVSSNGSADSIFAHGYHYVFGVLSPATDYLRGIIAVVLAKDPTAKTVALLGARDSFSKEVVAGAAEYAQSRGMKVVYQDFYPTDTQDLSQQLLAIKALHPDLLLGAGHVQDTLLLAKQAKTLCVSPKAMGFSVGPSSTLFRAYLQSQANYIFGATQWTSALKYEGIDPWGTPKAYAAAFTAQYPLYQEIPYEVAEASAAVIAFGQALEHASSLDPLAVRAALAQLDVMTFYGRIKFNQQGANIYKPMAVVQMQPDGKQYTVFPFDVAERAALYPMPSCR